MSKGDRYLGVVYICSLCRVRMFECKCDEIDDGWNRNRYTIPVDWDFYRIENPD